MRLAVVADIHANHHALAAVLAAIQVARADLLVCLGDLVGYNAEPSKCLQRIREAAGVVIAGNHDYCTVSQEPDWGTNTAARQAQAWTRLQLDATELAYLGGLPTHTVDSRGFVAVHGCYLNGTYLTGYVTGTMLEANLEAVAAKDSWPRVAFCGHTHAPLCGWLEGDRVSEDRLAAPIIWPSDAHAVLINPGSVGQPRDGDPRAAFAIVELENRRIEIHRLSYDIDGAARAILNAGLHPSLADRLRDGR